MAMLQKLAETALQRNGLELRELVDDFIRQHSQLSAVPRPETEDPQVLGTAAGLIELLAERSGQSAPQWTQEIGPVPTPVFLLQSAGQMKRLRALCESASPEPLRKRGLYAPPDFLTFA